MGKITLINSDLVSLMVQVGTLQRTLKNIDKSITGLSETVALKHRESASSDFVSKRPMLFCSKTKFITWMDQQCQTLVYHARGLEGYGEELEKEFEEGELKNDEFSSGIE